MFVLYREGYEIYGVGETPDEARKDAVEWLDGGMAEADQARLIKQEEAVLGGLYISGCTQRLALALREDKGDLVFDWNADSLLDVVEGESTEE